MASDPTWRRPEAEAVAPQLQRLADFFDGTDAVRARASTYLPRLSKESEANYQLRSTGVAVPGQLTRTVEASVGRIFAVAPTLEPSGFARIAEHWEDIDGLGTHGDVFLATAGQFAVLDGFALVLVDAPPAPAARVPLPVAEAFRPRWVLYRRHQLCSWSVAPIDGRLVLTRVTLAFDADVPDGEWGTTTEPRVRVLRRSPEGVVTAEVWGEITRGAEKVWALLEGPFTYPQHTEIPLAVLAGGKVTAPFVVRPPLLPLCDKVIESWQVASDIRHNERMACFPQPVVEGQLAASPTGEPGQLVLGPTSAVQVEQGGKFYWAELTGASLEQLRAGQQERLREIGALGLSFLVSETRSAETARAKALDAAAENATLATAARGIEDGANLALQFHAAYYDTPAADAPTVSLNKNLSGEVLDAPLVKVLHEMRAGGELSRAEFREILARGRVIPAEMATEEKIAEAETEAAVDAAIRAALAREPAPEEAQVG